MFIKGQFGFATVNWRSVRIPLECILVFKIFLYRLLDRAWDIILMNRSFSFADCRLIAENRIFCQCICPNIPLYISNFVTTILLLENKYTNNDMMLEWRKQSVKL